MTPLNKTITRYMLVATLISLSGYTEKLHGAEDSLALQWGLSVREGRKALGRAYTNEPSFMEDRHIAQTTGKFTFFGVFDGNRGDAAAEFVKKNLVKNFLKEQAETTKKRLINAFLTTDRDFLGDPKFQENKSGTTAVVAVVEGNWVYIANTGDSRGIVSRNGEVLLTTKDHKPKLPQERERIEKAGGSVSNDRVNGQLASSRAIGNRPYKDSGVIANPDIYEMSLNEGDVLILASDGLWDFMSNEAVAGLVDKRFKNSINDLKSWTKEPTLDDEDEAKPEFKHEESNNEKAKLVARFVRNEAYKKNGDNINGDNISVLIVKVVSSLLRAKADDKLAEAELAEAELKKKKSSSPITADSLN